MINKLLKDALFELHVLLLVLNQLRFAVGRSRSKTLRAQIQMLHRCTGRGRISFLTDVLEEEIRRPLLVFQIARAGNDNFDEDGYLEGL
jgi:hypothetical protein